MFSLKLIKGICRLNEPAFVLETWYVQQAGQDRPKQTGPSPPCRTHTRMLGKKWACVTRSEKEKKQNRALFALSASNILNETRKTDSRKSTPTTNIYKACECQLITSTFWVGVFFFFFSENRYKNGWVVI